MGFIDLLTKKIYLTLYSQSESVISWIASNEFNFFVCLCSRLVNRSQTNQNKTKSNEHDPNTDQFAHLWLWHVCGLLKKWSCFLWLDSSILQKSKHFLSQFISISNYPSISHLQLPCMGSRYTCGYFGYHNDIMYGYKYATVYINYIRERLNNILPYCLNTFSEVNYVN